MNILTEAIVSNSDMIKNYRTCREKTESFNKIFILKNNQPDAVLFSISAYEKVAILIEYLESLSDDETEKFIDMLPKIEKRKNYLELM